MIELTHGVLVDRAVKWLKNSKRCGVVFKEPHSWSITGEIPDAIGWCGGRSILVECKTNRRDYFSDKQKTFRQLAETGMGVHRYYMTPPGLVVPEEIKNKWGLLWVYEKQVREKKRSIIFNRKDASFHEIIVLYSALRRACLQGYMDGIYD